MSDRTTAVLSRSPRSRFWINLRKQKYQQLFVLIGVVHLLIFAYTPMFGIVMAFKDYSIVQGISGIFTSDWVGFYHFQTFFSSHRFLEIIRNTLAMSLLKLFFTFPVPIIFALMLNELRAGLTKRLVQTVSYLPYFISWVVVAGLAVTFLSAQRGLINTVLVSLSVIEQPIPILTDPGNFYGLVVGTIIWKEMGWWAIIFLAAIAGVDPALYDVAEMDGAGRLQRIWFVTIPGIKGAIVIVFILSIGNMLGGGLMGSNFDQAYLLGNPINNSTSEIVQTYALRMGLNQGRFAYAAAIDLLQSVISVFLIFTSNFVAKKLSGSGLF